MASMADRVASMSAHVFELRRSTALDCTTSSQHSAWNARVDFTRFLHKIIGFVHEDIILYSQCYELLKKINRTVQQQIKNGNASLTH